jgi:hypothetical protein
MKTKERSTSWLTVPQAAEELQIPRNRCYELIQCGELLRSLGTAKRAGFTPGRAASVGHDFWPDGAASARLLATKNAHQDRDRGEGHR